MIFVVLVAAGAFALAAVPLAMIGRFEPGWLLLLMGFVAGVLGTCVRRPPVRLVASPGATVAVLIPITVVSAMGLAFPTQHFVSNRDPGVYALTGVWLEREGTLLVDPSAAPFADVDGVTTRAGGFYAGRDDGRLYAQFAHLTHTLLGAGAMLGGTELLVRLNVLVGAMGLVMLYTLAQRLARGWTAVLVTTAVSVSLPQVFFSRGPYSGPAR